MEDMQDLVNTERICAKVDYAMPVVRIGSVVVGDLELYNTLNLC